MRSAIAVVLFALFLSLACDSGSDEEESSSEPTLEELIAECEDVAECAACPSERQAIEDWQAAKPVYELDCSAECVRACEMTGENCDGAGFQGCLSDCSDMRTADYDAWSATGDQPIADLNACTDACVSAESSEACITPIGCAEATGVGVATGDAPWTCESRLTELFG